MFLPTCGDAAAQQQAPDPEMEAEMATAKTSSLMQNEAGTAAGTTPGDGGGYGSCKDSRFDAEAKTSEAKEDLFRSASDDSSDEEAVAHLRRVARGVQPCREGVVYSL